MGFQSGDHFGGDEVGNAGGGERRAHRHHSGNEDYRFPAYHFVGRIDRTHAPQQHHEQSGHDDRSDGRNTDLVGKDHECHHGYHNAGGKGGFVVERHVFEFFGRVADDDPFAQVGFHLFDVVPRAVHQHHVARMDGLLLHFVADAASGALDGEDVHVVALSEARIFNRLVDEFAFGTDEDFGKSEVVEVEFGVVFAHLFGKEGEVENLHELVDVFACAEGVEHIADIENSVGADGLLHHAAEELVVVAFFEEGDAEAAVEVEFLRCLTHHGGVVADLEFEDELVEFVLVEESEEVAPFIIVLFLPRLFVHEDTTQNVEHHQSDHEAGRTNPREVEKSEAAESVVAQVAVDNEVGRRTDEGEHTAHARSESERHHEVGGGNLGTFGHGQNDGQEERHRSGVGNEGGDKGGDTHHEKEEFGFARAGHAQEFA